MVRQQKLIQRKICEVKCVRAEMIIVMKIPFRIKGEAETIKKILPDANYGLKSK